MTKIGYLMLVIWFCLSQITLNQHPNRQRQYAVKKIQNRQSKDLKKIANFNRPQQHHQKLINPNSRFSSRSNPFHDYLNGESSEMVLEKTITNDEWNNDVVNHWNTNSWQPPSGWQSGGWSNNNGWNNGWWEPDPWKDPYKKLSLVKIKPEIQEIYAADVLIRENRNSNFGINGFVQFVQFVSIEIKILILNFFF